MIFQDNFDRAEYEMDVEDNGDCIRFGWKKPDNSYVYFYLNPKHLSRLINLLSKYKDKKMVKV